MNDLTKNTITTLEVAEMMETEHSKIIRKLEGAKDRKGFLQILTEAQMGVSDYFIPATYRDGSGKENRCYEVTKLGCDFLANKSTGEKGVLFTARYVRRFYEMESHVRQVPLTEHPGEVANLIKILSGRMDKQGTAPYKVSETAKMVCEQYGIMLPDDFVKVPEYEQMNLPVLYGESIGNDQKKAGYEVRR